MKVWITEIGEPLPLEKNVRLHRYGLFSKYLAKHGHEVTWWTSSFSHTPKKHFADKDTEIDHEGARVVLIHGPGYKKNVSYDRIRHQSHFAKRFYDLAQKEEVPDLIITPVPTIEVAELATKFAKENKVKVLVDIRDLWPDEFVDLAPPILQPLARLILQPQFNKMRKICQAADVLTGVSNSFLEYGLQFSGRDRSDDFVFPLGYPPISTSGNSSTSFFEKMKKIGWSPGGFNICFFGTIGRFFDLATVIKAATILGNHRGIKFILAGDGSHLEQFKGLARGVDSVYFPGWLNQEEIREVMKHSSVGLAPYKVGARMTMPNKPFEYMAGGLPLLTSLKGELTEELESEKGGTYYQANKAEELAEKIAFLQKNPEICTQMGKNSKRLFDERFSIDVVFSNTKKQLEDLVEK